MVLIFRTIFGNFLERFSADCKTFAGPVVAATVGMYNTILADLRPTPAKSHYTYNLRDLSKVFQASRPRVGSYGLGQKLKLLFINTG